MTPGERAEKMMLIALDLPSCDWNEHGRENLARIATEIRAAVEEEHAETLCKCLKIAQEETTLCRRSEPAEDILSGQVGASSRIAGKIQNILQGHSCSETLIKADAYEDAAKICDERIEDEMRIAMGTKGQGKFQCQAAIDALGEVSEAIRARAKGISQ